MNPDETILKTGLKQGKKEVFELLYRSYSGSLTRYATSLTGDSEASREIVQDLFLELWEKQNTLEIRGTVKTYLFSAVYHRGLNWIRARRIRELYATNPQEIWRWFAYPAPTDRLDPLQLKIIETQISLLPPQCREVFTRAVINDEKTAEIARSLGLNEKTVENHLARAKKILRKKLSKIR